MRNAQCAGVLYACRENGPTYDDVDHLELEELWDVEPDGEEDDGQKVVKQVAPRTGPGLNGIYQTWNEDYFYSKLLIFVT